MDKVQLSHILHKEYPTLPDLTADSRVAFVVLGGGTLQHWVNKHYLAGLGKPEVHIYDGDEPKYQAYCKQINQRSDGSWAIQMTKSELENYLHPDAIFKAFGIKVSFGDQDDVPAIVGEEMGWNSKTAKKKLSAQAFPLMTIQMLRVRDPHDEVKGWMERLASML